MIIRCIANQDVEQVLGIYDTYVRNTGVTFEENTPSFTEFKKRVMNITAELPWLVAEEEGTIAGYAYASPHRSRAAYRWTKEVSVYIHPDFHRRHLASALYHALLQLVRQLGVNSVLAGITQPNDASTRFHAHLGFREVGVYHNVGFKQGEWRDVLWMEKHLNLTAPEELRLFADHSSDFWVQSILEEGTKMIR